MMSDKEQLIALMRASITKLGRLSVDPRLNEEEQAAISFVAGYAAASFEEETGDKDVTDLFYEGSRQ